MKPSLAPFFRSLHQITTDRQKENAFMISPYLPILSTSNSSFELLNRIEVISYRCSFSHPEGASLIKKKDFRIRSLLQKYILAVKRIVAIEILLKTPSDQRRFKEREIRISKESRLAQINLAGKDKHMQAPLHSQKTDLEFKFLNAFQIPLPVFFWKKKEKKKKKKEEEQGVLEDKFELID